MWKITFEHSINAESCYGKTKRHFKVRMCEHLGVSALTGKRVKGDNDFAIREHHLFWNHSSDFDDFSILASNNNDFKVTLMESLLINRDQPPLNKDRHSLPLELFDDWDILFYPMIAVDLSNCSLWYHIGIILSNEWYLFINFNLVAYDFLKFDWCKMLNGYPDFSFNIFSLRITFASVETLVNWR